MAIDAPSPLPLPSPPPSSSSCFLPPPPRTVLTEYAGVFKVVGIVVDDGDEEKGEGVDPQVIKSTLDGLELR